MNRGKFKTQSLLLLLAISGFASSVRAEKSISDSSKHYFNQAIEFPNYFLPPHYSSLTKVERKKILSERRKLLEKAVWSILKRLQVPVVVEGSNTFKNVFYFDYLEAEIAKIDKDAEVFPSGGVIRAVLSYLYEQMDFQMRLDSKSDPLDLLRRVSTDKRPIEAAEVRGVNADFDILARCSEAVFEAVSKRVLAITNSAETQQGATHDQSKAKRLFFTIGDVKKYKEQISESTSQGGSSLDWLAMSMKTRKFIEPLGHDYIISDFLEGYLRYLPSTQGTKKRSPQKQTVRGIRPLLEFPFLNYRDESVLRSEVTELISDLKTGKPIEANAIEQIGKAIRNGRRSLGSNRVLRGEPGSIEELIFQFSKTLKDKKLEYIPEYVESFLLETRSPSDRAEQTGVPASLLISYQEFRDKYSDHGSIYHGTPSLDNAMAILRGGLIVSGGVYDQGGSMEGKGGYAAKRIGEAKHFQNGFILPLKVKNDSRLNILVWKDGDPFLQEAAIQAKAENVDLHTYLRRHHHIDLIIKNAVLIQNMEAIELGSPSERIKMIVEATLSGARDRMRDLESRRSAVIEYFKLCQYGNGLGIFAPDLLTLNQILIEVLEKSSTVDREEDDTLFLNALSHSIADFRELPPETFRKLSGAMIRIIREEENSRYNQIGHTHIFKTIAEILVAHPELKTSAPEIYHAFEEKLKATFKSDDVKDFIRRSLVFFEGNLSHLSLGSMRREFPESFKIYWENIPRILRLPNFERNLGVGDVLARDPSLAKEYPDHVLAALESESVGDFLPVFSMLILNADDYKISHPHFLKVAAERLLKTIEGPWRGFAFGWLSASLNRGGFGEKLIRTLGADSPAFKALKNSQIIGSDFVKLEEKYREGISCAAKVAATTHVVHQQPTVSP